MGYIGRYHTGVRARVTMVLSGCCWRFQCAAGRLGDLQAVRLGGKPRRRRLEIIQQLFIFPLNYARESLSSATNLGLFVPFLDESNIISRFLGTIDLFIVWWLIVLAIGLGVLYRRKTAPIFWSFMGVYVVIALVIALVMRGASGGA